MRGSFVGQAPRQRGWHRVGIGLAGVFLGALPILALTSQGGAALLQLAESCNPPTITSAGAVTATAGASFNFTVTTCTTAVPTIKSAHLPSGLTLKNNGDGTATISGKPGVRDAGIYNATITAAVAGQTSAVQTLAVAVDNTPAFTTKAVYLAHTGTAFTFQIVTRYGYPIPSIASGSTLPSGVVLTDNHNGTATLHGDPGSPSGGAYPLTITASTGLSSSTQHFALTVYQAPSLTSSTSDSAITGQAMTPFAVTDAGFPLPVLRAVGLPKGVTLVGGELQGTPTTAGTYAVTITAKSKAGTTTQPFTFSVVDAGSIQLDEPTAITEDNGFLWITNVGNDTVTELTVSGSLVQTLSGASYGFDDPVAISGDGSDVFVVNKAGSVTEIDAESGQLVQVLQGSSYSFAGPSALLLNGSDGWVVNSTGATVTEFNLSTGALVQVLSNQSDSRYSFDDPVAIGAVGSNIWIVNNTGASTTDALSGSATVINGATGAFVQQVTGPSLGLDNPAGVAYSGGNVWITDSADYQITELTTSGSLVQVITNSSNDANYGFDHPTAIVASSTHVYVVDPPGSSPMITEVNTSNAEGDWFECNTNIPDPDFDNPTGLALAGSDAWVVSPANNTLTELDLSQSGQAIAWIT
jgi:Putative Ig domain